MRPIDRGREPRDLRVLRSADPLKKWDSGGAKEAHAAIRDRLLSVQDYCCGYCERPLGKDTGSVEHIHPRTEPTSCEFRPSENHHYDWCNLLLVCKGNGTCDDPKKGRHLCADIYFPDTIGDEPAFIVDRLTGALVPDPSASVDRQLMIQQTIKELCLNEPGLKRSRLAVVVQLHRRIIEGRDEVALARFEERHHGFPTTVDLICRDLAC